MNIKRNAASSIVVLFCIVLISACATPQVGLEPTSTPTPSVTAAAVATATHTPAPRSPTATLTHTPAPTSPTPTATESAVRPPSPTVDLAPGWETYRSARYAVRFRYPPGWQLDTMHGGEAYRGEDGYFILDAVGSGGVAIDQVTASQVNHPLLPYGTNPTIEELKVGGQEARLILPATDASMVDQAMLIVRYPQPVAIRGTAYDYFAMYADVAHIHTIAQTLQFTSEGGVE